MKTILPWKRGDLTENLLVFILMCIKFEVEKQGFYKLMFTLLSMFGCHGDLMNLKAHNAMEGVLASFLGVIFQKINKLLKNRNNLRNKFRNDFFHATFKIVYFCHI